MGTPFVVGGKRRRPSAGSHPWDRADALVAQAHARQVRWKLPRRGSVPVKPRRCILGAGPHLGRSVEELAARVCACEAT